MLKANIQDDFFMKERLSPRILYISCQDFEIYKVFRQVIEMPSMMRKVTLFQAFTRSWIPIA